MLDMITQPALGYPSDPQEDVECREGFAAGVFRGRSGDMPASRALTLPVRRVESQQFSPTIEFTITKNASPAPNPTKNSPLDDSTNPRPNRNLQPRRTRNEPHNPANHPDSTDEQQHFFHHGSSD